MQLSLNFTLEDLTTKASFPHKLRAQKGKTEDELLASLKDLANNVLEPLFAKYGKAFIITSGFRTTDAASNSQHFLGEAVDVQFIGLSKSEGLARGTEMLSVLSEYDQFIVEYHGKHGPVFHISYRKDKCRRQCLTTPDLKQYLAGIRAYGDASVIG